MDLLSVLRILQRRIWIIVIIPSIAITCAIFFVSKMDKVYRSTAQIATGITTDDAIKVGDETENPWETNTKFINIIESMNSLPVISLVSYKLILHDIEGEDPFRIIKDPDDLKFELNDEFLAKAKEVYKERYQQMRPLNSFDPMDRRCYELLQAFEYDDESLHKNFRINRLNNSDFISVDFYSENPFLSAMTVNALCEEYLRFNKILKSDKSSESVEFFEKLVAEKKRILDEKTEELNNFKVSNRVVNYGAETESKISQITEYELNKEKEEKRVNGLQLSLQATEEKLRNFDQQNEDEILNVNQRIIELRREINTLNSKGNPTDDDKGKLNNLRDELQLQITRLDKLSKSTREEDLKELQKERDQLQLELQIARADLAAITTSLQNLKYDVSGFATKEARISDLQREVQVASEEYLSAQDKYNTAKNKALVVGSSIRQILEGRPSYEPEPSKTLMILGLVGFSSFALCVGVILFVEYLDFTIRVPSRLEKVTQTKNISTINLVDRKEFDLRRIFSEEKVDKQTGAFIHFLRKLRFEVENSKGRVFLFTSTQSNVGKSFIIINLSYTLSLINKRILIIDTNFKHNSLTQLLLPKLEERKLLKRGYDETHLLESHRNGEEINGKPSGNKNFIYATEYQGIDIIGNLKSQDSPSEILAGRNFKDMIKSLSEQYDYILLEGPALNEYSDTKELIEFVDKVVPVFSAESILKSLDMESISYLRSLKTKLLGTILNKVQFKNLTV